MWRVLRKRLGEQGGELVDVLEKLYTKTTAKLQGFKKEIPIELGLRQGAPESCMLFNYWCALHDIEKEYPGAGIKFNYNISDECTDRAQRRKHRSRGNLLAKLILYADDIVGAARSKEELEGMMQIITKHFTEFGLRVAESKTVTMTWRTTPDIQEATTLISLNGKDLENVRSFRYLGHWLTNDPKHPKYLNQQVGAVQGTWSKDRRFYTDKDINLHTRVKVAEARVRSRLTYALQSDRLTGRQCRTVDSVWMRMLGSMVRADLQEMVQIRRDSPTLMRVSYRPVTPGRHPASANNSTCGIWHTCAAWKTTHFRNNCCLHRRARRRSATGSDWPTTIRSTRASSGAPSLRQEGGKRVATGNTWRTLTADMPVQQHE